MRWFSSPPVLALALILISLSSSAQQKPIEIHDRLAPQAGAAMEVALTLDACSGKYDDDLIEFLIRNHIPATIFATKKWLDRNPFGVSVIRAHLDQNSISRNKPDIIDSHPS